MCSRSPHYSFRRLNIKLEREGSVRLGFCGFAGTSLVSGFRDAPCGNIGP